MIVEERRAPSRAGFFQCRAMIGPRSGGANWGEGERRTRLRRYREPSFRILDTDIKDKTAEKQSRGAQSQRQGLA
jgi:hypothetical protein